MSMASSSEKSKILVIGATGYIGKFIVEASANLGHCTFALVRESVLDDPTKLQTLEHLKSLGVNLLFGDIHDHRSLVNAIKQVDVVISAVGHRSSYTPMQDQVKIVAAIKEAGNIKRFIPSEFGMDVDRVDGAVEPAKSLFETKSKFRRVVQEEGIPYTIVCANYFARSCLPSFYLPTFEASPKDRLLILGDGNVKGVFNLEEDIGAYTIKAVDDPRTLNKILYIRPSSNMYSFNDIVSLWETKIGRSVDRIYLHDQQILENVQEATDRLTKLILAVGYSAFVKGDQTNYEIEASSGVEASALYPDVKYTTVEELLDHSATELKSQN